MAFPNVPNLPGVPSLARDPLASFPQLVLLAADVIQFFGLFAGPQWGVFLDGVQVVAPDSVVSFDYRQTSYVSDYPLEQGAFESYDKVATPFETRVRLACGGAVARRQEFLASVDAIQGTTDLYDVVTPEVVYRSVNVTHYDYKRTAREGVGLILVDLHLLEVRVTATARFTNTKSPSAQSTQNSGIVQPSPASDAEQKMLPQVT